MACIIEIVCLGNELLIGKTLNTNAQWLSGSITRLGGRVTRITTVGDDVEAISTAIEEAVARRPNFIITTGGLGPTHDDKTLEALSKALERPLHLDNRALEILKERYCRASPDKTCELTPARIKMAKLPEGGEPLSNPVGSAPGVLIRHGAVTLIALPGVPKEMRGIFEGSVARIIRATTGNLYIYEKSLMVAKVGESRIAPLIDKTMYENPLVYIKSHPRQSSPNLLEIHLSTTSESKRMARTLVERSAQDISKLITGIGGKIKPLVTQNQDPPSPS